nr:hypothetical protein [Planctomycetota bacterium]
AGDAGLDEAVLSDRARGEERDRRGLQAGGRIHWAVGLPGGRGLAVAQSGRRAIEIIEHPGFLSLGAIGTGRPPERMVASARLNRLYALIPESDELLVLAPSEMQVVARSSLEDQPVDLDLDRREERLAVACAGSGRVLVLDAASLEILQSIQVGPRLRAVIFDDRSERLFVATDLPPSVQAIELGTGQVTSIGRLPSGAADLELDPDGRLIWAACPDASRLVALDRFSLRLQASIEVPARPDRLLAPGRATR